MIGISQGEGSHGSERGIVLFKNKRDVGTKLEMPLNQKGSLPFLVQLVQSRCSDGDH